ncbi:hypothetical protein [Campylobacter portucalensis]|nr:hypothetical protein [Campylobacter portucalensis]
MCNIKPTIIITKPRIAISKKYSGIKARKEIITAISLIKENQKDFINLF